MTYRLLPPAFHELRKAAAYYEDNASGLGFEFIADVRAAVRRVLANPEAWQALDKDFRRCRTIVFLTA